MSEYTDNCKRIIEIIRTRPWLFRKNAPNFNLPDYIRHFEHHTKSDFFLFPTMLPFKVEILDKYKDKVFNTAFMGTDIGSISMNTIIQLSPTDHMFFLWGHSADGQDTVLYGTLYTDNPQKYRDFLIDNESLFFNDDKTGGFAGMALLNR
jgi:hypothetical protein